jgi:hypothetical protein
MTEETGPIPHAAGSSSAPAPSWIIQRPGLRPKTVDLYRWLLAKHIAPYGAPGQRRIPHAGARGTRTPGPLGAN